jgi:acyl-homoserine lactone acylase PvdQ
VLLESMRLHPDRADALLQKLASTSSVRQSLTLQRAAIVAALADALREREVPVNAPVLFAHPLAVTDAARRRFNVTARAPASASPDPFAMTFDPADWDRSTAVGAPGQSESPDSPYFANLARLWSAGQTFMLAFSDRAVQANAAATLTLMPKSRSVAVP